MKLVLECGVKHHTRCTQVKKVKGETPRNKDPQGQHKSLLLGVQKTNEYKGAGKHNTAQDNKPSAYSWAAPKPKSKGEHQKTAAK